MLAVVVASGPELVDRFVFWFCMGLERICTLAVLVCGLFSDSLDMRTAVLSLLERRLALVQ
jgi:hypothetical protein